MTEYINTFNDELRKSATIIKISENGSRFENKIIHRLLTCSYDSKLINGQYYIYMSGLLNKEKLLCFQLDTNETKTLWKWIERRQYGNCEDRDFLGRIICYISYRYICDEIATRYPNKHKQLKKNFDSSSVLSKRVSLYLEGAKECFWDEDEYITLLDISNHNFNDRIRDVVIRYLPRFFEFDKGQYVLGEEIDKEYVKFSFAEEKKVGFRRFEDGKYYRFIENTVAEDYFEGCGFSFGEINKAFHYFQSGLYGEQLMFVRTVAGQRYYIREYEYLGKKLEIKSIQSMGNVKCIKYILEHMSEEEKKKFFTDRESNCFKGAFGSVTATIDKMEEYDADNELKIYDKAIKFLCKEKRKYKEKNICKLIKRFSKR